MCKKWDVRVSIQHRLGRVEIGESSLIVVVGSKHRDQAYQASQYSVDRIKQIVPIWKKEYFVGGEICLKAEIAIVEMPEGLRRRATSKEMFWFNYGTKNVEVEGRSFPPQSVTRDEI